MKTGFVHAEQHFPSKMDPGVSVQLTTSKGVNSDTPRFSVSLHYFSVLCWLNYIFFYGAEFEKKNQHNSFEEIFLVLKQILTSTVLWIVVVVCWFFLKISSQVPRIKFVLKLIKCI